MNALSGHGLVLRRSRHLESDLRMTVLLRDFGKFIVVSKGGQKPASRLKGLQEPFCEADFQVYAPHHGIHGRLGGGKLKDSHPGLRSRIEAFHVASKAAETVDVLVPYRAPAPDVYDILRQTFRTLHAGGTPAVGWVMFVVRLLNVLGHGDLSDKAAELIAESEINDPAFDRCTAFADGELERVLPWKLKSDLGFSTK